MNANDPLSFNTGDLDVSAQVTKMKALNPDGVVVSADYSQAVTVLREMKRQGMIKPVVGSTQLISSAILKAAPEIPIVAPATFYATMKGDKPEKFVNELQPLLRKTSGLPPEIEPSMYDANIYEIASIYIDAIKKARRHRQAGRPRRRPHQDPRLHGQARRALPASAARSASTTTATPSRRSIIVQGQNGAWESKVRGCSAARRISRAADRASFDDFD